MQVYKIEDYVDNIVNISGIDVNELVHICKRVNNSKRDFLFVNTRQGKHIPQKPHLIFELYQKLYAEVVAKLKATDRVLVVGFAETATAISNYLADTLPNCVYRLQTTRETFDSKFELFKFDEEHSHAVEQKLYSVYDLPAYDVVLFVDDEITTGNTVVNFMKQFKKHKGEGEEDTTKYMVASFLNWQNEKDKQVFTNYGIATVALVTGQLKTKTPILDVNTRPLARYKAQRNIVQIPNYFGNKAEERLGGVPYNVRLTDVQKTVKSILAHDILDLSKRQKVLVLGIEEYMYIPLCIAHGLEATEGIHLDDIVFHAFTRSPITVVDENEYGITDGVTLTSLYDENRNVYLYDTEGHLYDRVLVICNREYTEHFMKSVEDAFKDTLVFFIQLV